MKAVIPGTSLAIHPDRFPDPVEDVPTDQDAGRAVLAGGCFWCVEAVYQPLDGVQSVVSGYAGGDAASANYEAVCSGRTGHAEVVEVRYDPRRISFGALLKLFFAVAHDPTQKDRQGNDRGPQYRSAIFPVDEAQRKVAEDYIQQLNNAGAFTAPIVTTLEPGHPFHPAEDYHQDFARRNPNQPYITHVAKPKLEKLHAAFPEMLKT
ncbi:MAG: peptide-methionine (S)-S-oxide reductase MsrA [Alcanivorax sp.]|jgi:peptide-methionine (S)-S-oxide reductase|uniref:Peptide methionine sulfoxide reductase MsrA n=1 Tax=Alloalcanivorax venustensis ISO4 TaxID=1177184 RepID=A0ABS0AJI2_9GAMM|nr:peptide-methionine (S)-S-oxide reductase MsrA [Alloalcanivorax venustensis]MAD70254.1 peptide-methionine (S)-S-oxide reductase [Alcanivorax sp.]MEA3260976.1 peptide-methionine (S)-S-oxide reductase MsrA [Pseudomonadota bacterium]SMO77044.1 peptide-methionine (S)-S-oxide reductase [Alcanivorax sp. DSM 26295]MAK22669.1 peptide-methionine (S)-S-oxide reductase [Alcanivorax sp.]MAQ34770.1 peptide-methionine (S)-S-oxide reductase [Alcanivorax sp.]|tara:strand:- start:14525 stop:15145 length:621 start_codon:yes stop_codon:yes gene_type:complete